MMQQQDTQSAIKQQLISDLTQPRELLEQVLEEINKHEYPADQLEAFFTEKYPKLEDYEIDLIFSPLFTPLWEDRLRYSELLGKEVFSETDLKALCDDLSNQALQVTYKVHQDDGWPVPLHLVNLERFVNRLLLDKPLAEGLSVAIEQNVPSDEQAAIRLLGRDPVWQNGWQAGQSNGNERSELFAAFLNVFAQRKNYTLDKASYLSDFLRTYRPESVSDLPRQLQNMIASCDSDLTGVADQSFHDQQLMELYSESERAHYKRDDVRKHYEHLKLRAQELLEDFQQLPSTVAGSL